jgi:hypothetical protein
MSAAISFRLTEEDAKNLAVIEASGMSRTESIRTALASEARRRRQYASLADEAERLAKDERDLEVVRETRDFFTDSFEDLPV